MMLRKLAGQTAIYGISTIVSKLLSYLLTPYLTRIMTTAEYGVVTDLYALIPFLLVLLTMGMEIGYFRFAGQAETDTEKRNVFQTTWGAVSLVAGLFLVGVALFHRPLARVMDYGDFPSYVLLMAAIVAIDAALAIPFAKLRQEGRAARYVVARIVSVVITVILSVFFYSVVPAIGGFSEIFPASYGPGYYLVANLVASAAMIFLLWPAVRGYVPKIDKPLLRVIFLYSLPLLISGIAGVANEFIDRQFIKYLMPPELALSSLGIYGAVVKIGVILLLFVQMYRIAAEPFFLSGFKHEEFVRANAEAMKFFVIVSITLFLGIGLFPDLFGLIIGADFRQGMYILPIVLLANIFSGAVLNLSFWYKKSGKTQFAVVITGTGLLFTVILNLIFIPRMGYVGAAWARLVCELVMAALSYALCRHFFPIPYDLRRIGGYFLLGGVLYGAGLATREWLPHLALAYIANLGLILIFVGYAAKREGITPRKYFKQFRQ